MSGKSLRVELSEDDAFDLAEVLWSGEADALVGTFVVVSNEVDGNVTVNGDDWQRLPDLDDETLTVLTPSAKTTERIAELHWFSEGGVTSSSAGCYLLAYGRWLLDWSWNDDGLARGVTARPRGRLHPSDVADWLANCDLAPGRMDGGEWEALNLSIEFPQDEAVLQAVMQKLPKVAMPGWSINGVRYLWDMRDQRWRAISDEDWAITKSAPDLPQAD